MKINIAQEITDLFVTQIEEMLKSGTKPQWKMPWASGAPVRADGTPYRGINVLILGMAASRRGYTSQQWFGFSAAKDAAAKSARKAGRNIEKRDRKSGKGYYLWDCDNDCLFEGGVRKGETATRIVFYKPTVVTDKRKDGTERERVIPFMRHLSVFNAEQIEGIPAAEVVEVEFNSVDCAEDVINGWEVDITYGGDRAFYSPGDDSIHMPAKQSFHSEAEFYGVAMHEITHSTGHHSRLDRPKGNAFGSKEYAFEELIAELGSAFLCQHCGVEGYIQHVEYLSSWLEVLKNDTSFIIKAASKAQHAADLVLGIEPVEYEKAA